MAVHFDENHRFGCPECFKVFAQKLQDVIGTIQPGSIHRGRIPSGKEQHAAIEEAIARARDKMGHAIKSENYEEAARLRDEILKLNTMLSQPALD
jgi:protein arginine kinase activator